VPSLFGLAPGGVYRAAGVTADAVRSYRTFSPLPRPTQHAAAVCFLWHFPWARARRTLSGTACLWSPDFPPRQPFGFAGAAVRPTDTPCMGAAGSAVKSRALNSPNAHPPAGGPAAPANPARSFASIDRPRRRHVRGGNDAGKPPPHRAWWNRIGRSPSPRIRIC